MSTQDLKDELRHRKRESPIAAADLLSTGSTLLNLACSGRAKGGLAKGGYYFLVGDSMSGKTWLSLSILAEACLNPAFKDYRLIYDNAEDGALMDVGYYFGDELEGRLAPPQIDLDADVPVYSSTVEDFYFNVDDAYRADRPFIYILDSMDALSSSDEQAKFDEHKTAARKGKEAAGSYGDGKAKKNSAGIRQLLPKLRDTGSILIVICQTRDSLGFGFESKTRSGGRALRFYAQLEIWSSVVKTLKKRIKVKDRQVGVNVKFHIKKNRLTGMLRQVDIPIYHEYGIDDIGSCVDYLVDEEVFGKSGNNIIAKGLFEKDESLRRASLIRHIEDEDLVVPLRKLVADTWAEVDEACAMERRRKYE